MSHIPQQGEAPENKQTSSPLMEDKEQTLNAEESKEDFNEDKSSVKNENGIQAITNDNEQVEKNSHSHDIEENSKSKFELHALSSTAQIAALPQWENDDLSSSIFPSPKNNVTPNGNNVGMRSVIPTLELHPEGSFDAKIFDCIYLL